jgi:hypothetical protein
MVHTYRQITSNYVYEMNILYFKASIYQTGLMAIPIRLLKA